MNCLFDTAIVGAGLAGAFIATVCSGREHVIVLDAGEKSPGASQVPIGLMSPLMARRARPVWRMTEAFESFERFIAAAEAHAECPKTGVLKPAFSEKQAGEFREAAERWPEHGRWYTNSETKERWPYVVAPGGALFVHTGRTVDMPGLCRNLVGRAVKRGAETSENTKLLGWIEDATGIVIRTDRGEFRSRRLVVAAGYGSLAFPEIAALDLHPIKGQWLRLVKAESINIHTPVSAGGYVAQSQHAIHVGSTFEHEFADMKPTQAAREGIMTNAVHSVPSIERSKIEQDGSAVRMTVPGIRLPMVGPVTPKSRVWIVSGLGSKGLLMAPYIARHVKEWMLNPDGIPRQLRVAVPGQKR